VVVWQQHFPRYPAAPRGSCDKASITTTTGDMPRSPVGRKIISTKTYSVSIARLPSDARLEMEIGPRSGHRRKLREITSAAQRSERLARARAARVRPDLRPSNLVLQVLCFRLSIAPDARHRAGQPLQRSSRVLRCRVWRSNKNKPLYLLCGKGLAAFECPRQTHGPVALRRGGRGRSAAVFPYRSMLTEQAFARFEARAGGARRPRGPLVDRLSTGVGRVPIARLARQ
jgi:hypothetical protein